jgi:hypothetical protein
MSTLIAEGLDPSDIATFGYRSERWNFVEGEAMTGIIAKLNKEQNRYVLSTGTARVVWKTLAFYPGATLVRVTDLAWRPAGLTLYFVGMRGNYKRLDGSRRFIQFLNEKVPLKLTTANVVDYLKFYSFFVHSHGRPFLLAEKPEDLGHFQSALSPEKLASLTDLLKPVTLASESPEAYTLTATVRYADGLYACEFQVTPTGLVRMTKDEELPAGLPKLAAQPDLAPAWG